MYICCFIGGRVLAGVAECFGYWLLSVEYHLKTSCILIFFLDVTSHEEAMESLFPFPLRFLSLF